ncbi:acetyltransferase [Ferrimonas pelagia]|uniref:Acetyltransferase n=1 Tax=Ferrimonas pelagia TaxID=1177826 RepID=A0ABP9FIG0_9GAMM
MLLREKSSGDLVEVIDSNSLLNPFVDQVKVQFQCGQDLADPEMCDKKGLTFPSGEGLPECWLNGHYRTKA